MRVSIPSVSTSMRVSRPTRVSSRVRNPTVFPTGSPSKLRHARGDGARRHAARFQQQDLSAAQPVAVQ
jgi:hypothetical protein